MKFKASATKKQNKSGKPLENADTLFLDKHERNTFLPLLRYLYGINFRDKIEFVSSLSLTSRKCLIYDDNGNKYFLKRKPEYSLEEPLKTRAVTFQSMLATQTTYVPQIIRTISDEPYAKINKSHYLLTRFVTGDIFGGRIEQSINCALKLGEMHLLAQKWLNQDEVPVDSTKSVMTFIGYAENLQYKDKALKDRVLNAITRKVEQYLTENKGLMGWIHSDYAPFNVVFSGDSVIAVNDFDNATFGNISKDVAECIISHCDINYNGSTSFLNKIIRTSIDTASMKQLFSAYVNTSSYSVKELYDLPNEMSLMWLKLMVLGLLRGDYSLESVMDSLGHADEVNKAGKNLLESIL